MDINLSKDLFNPLFFKLMRCKKPIVLSYGSAGSGKSFSQLQYFIYKCLTEKDQRILCIRQFYVDTKESIYSAFLFILKQWDILHLVKTNSVERKITFPNGSFIFCKGLEAGVENFKSLILTDIWIEEASQISESDFNQLLLRLRGEQAKNGKMWMTTNPTNTNIFIFKRFFESPHESEKDDVHIIKTTYHENKFLTDKDKKTIENFKNIDYNYYRCYGLGEWSNIKLDGLFYQDFKADKICKDISFNKSKPLHISFDENSKPYISLIVSQMYIDNGKTTVKVINEYVMYGKNLNTVLYTFINDYQGFEQPIYIYGDSTSQKSSVFLGEGENFYSIIQEVLNQHFNTIKKVLPSNKSVSTRGLFMNKIFRGELDDISIEIDFKCKNLIIDLESTLMDKDGGKDKSIYNDKTRGMKYQKHGHLSDTLDYLITQSHIQQYNNFKVGARRSFQMKGALRRVRGY